ERDGRRAVMTRYAPGAEPDGLVYEVLRRMDTDHVPELLDTGHWDGTAYEVCEEIPGGTLAEARLREEQLDRVASEIGKALHAFGECGLRHRDLRPEHVLVRSLDPLDLVITGFGSARLS